MTEPEYTLEYSITDADGVKTRVEFKGCPESKVAEHELFSELLVFYKKCLAEDVSYKEVTI